MGEGEAFTVLFSKVTAADIKKKKKSGLCFWYGPGLWFFFFFIKGQRTEWLLSAISAYKGTLVV